MDYKSYKEMCDSTLQQIRKSENTREELSDTLQKMYQEKSECEKSIIKTLQSQQKKFAEEKIRREERNESILRSMERVDYQAKLLAANSERLRALKRQYERYLLSLWTTRRIGAVYPVGNQLTGSFVKPFSAKYDESPIHQSSYYNANRSTFTTDLRTSNYLQAHPTLNSDSTFISNSNITSSHTPPYNQSHYSRVLLTPAAVSEDSIKAGNYLMTATTTGVSGIDMDSQFQFPYPSAAFSSSYQVPLSTPRFINTADSAVNTVDINPPPPPPPTINSIYTSQRRQCSDLPSSQHFSIQPSSSTITGFYPIYQHNSNQQPLENPHNNNNNNNNNNNYNNNSMRMSKALYGSSDNTNPLIMPAATASGILSTPQLLSYNENRLKNESKVDVMKESDDESFDEAKNCSAIRRNSQLEIPQIENAFDSVHLRRKSIEKTEPFSIVDDTSNESLDGNMHQVWEIEKVIEAKPALDAQHTSFVIPKIIVETQFDMAEATATRATAFPPEDIITTSNSIVDRDTPEKLLNQKMEKHSSDNGDSAATANDNNSPVMEVESSIYHYGKQQQQQQQRVDDEQQHMSVEHELQKFNDIKISGDDRTSEQMKGVTMTRETEIKSNNFDCADKINDDNGKQQQQQQPHTLNDKISEIYRKIARIEGEYYDEKEKIIENFEKRISSSSPTPDAVAALGNAEEISSIEPDEFANNTDTRDREDDEVVQSEFKPTELHENWDEGQVDGTQFNYDYQPDQPIVEESEEDNKQTLPNVEHALPAGPQPMFDNNQYASTSSKDHHQEDDNVVIDGGELQANFVEYPSSSSEMQYQQQQDYYGNDATGFEGFTQYEQDQQQQYQTPYEASQEQLDSNYQQNNNYDTAENLSNYNETSAVYYDPNLATDTHQIIYDDQNYSDQQPYQSNEGDSSQTTEYIYQQQNQEQFYDNNNGVYREDHSDETNYYGNSETQQEHGGELIETSNEINATTNMGDVGTFATGEEHYELQVPLETTNYDESQEQLQEDNKNEIFESQNYPTTTATTPQHDGDDDESFHGTASTISSESSKPSADIDMSGGDAVEFTKREDVKLVKQLLDSESDDTPTRSNLLTTAIKEEEKEDESDFDFSAN